MRKEMVSEQGIFVTRPGSEAGFSLTELMVVLVLIGLTALVASFDWNYITGESRVRTAAMEIYSDLQFARSNAVSENSTFVIVFDEDENSYRVLDDEDGDFEFDGPENASCAADTECIKQVDLDDTYDGKVRFGRVQDGAVEDGVTFSESLAPGNPRRARFTPMGLEGGTGGWIYLMPTMDGVEGQILEGREMGIQVKSSGLITLHKCSESDEECG